MRDSERMPENEELRTPENRAEPDDPGYEPDPVAPEENGEGNHEDGVDRAIDILDDNGYDLAKVDIEDQAMGFVGGPETDYEKVELKYDSTGQVESVNLQGDHREFDQPVGRNDFDRPLNPEGDTLISLLTGSEPADVLDSAYLERDPGY